MHQVVIGTILGDGYLYPRGVLQVEHAKKDHQYTLWKHKIMGSVVSGFLSLTSQRLTLRRSVSQ